MNEAALEELVKIIPTFKNLKILGLNECNISDEIIINLCFNLEVLLFFKAFFFYLLFQGIEPIRNNISQ